MQGFGWNDQIHGLECGPLPSREFQSVLKLKNKPASLAFSQPRRLLRARFAAGHLDEELCMRAFLHKASPEQPKPPQKKKERIDVKTKIYKK